MNISNLKTFIMFLSIAFVSTGCAKYATTGRMIEKIENQAYVGISEQTFRERIPNARLVDEKGDKKVYLVAVGDPCFFCGSGYAFLRSFEAYATSFTFQNGRLVSTDRIISGK